MDLIRDVRCFDMLEDTVVYAKGKGVSLYDGCASMVAEPSQLIQTKDFLAVVTGSESIGYYTSKMSLKNDSNRAWTKLPHNISPHSYNYSHNLLILFSGMAFDKLTYVYSLNDLTEDMYPYSVFFVPNADCIYSFNPLKFHDRNTKRQLQELDFKSKKPVAAQILGLLNDNVWMRIDDNKLTRLNLITGETLSINPHEILVSSGIDAQYIGFGANWNRNRLHIDNIRKRIVTFANRYYLEVNLNDYSTRVLDLDIITEEKLRIVVSSLDAKREWLFFNAGTVKDGFDNYYFGIFDIKAGAIIDLERVNVKDGMLTAPPRFNDNQYGVLTTEGVLYYKSIPV